MRLNIPVLARGLLAVWLILPALPAAAMTLHDLYETEVPVAGEDLDSRNQAIGQALAQVLVKLTGRDPAPGTASLAPQAPRYVQEYRFRRAVSTDGQEQRRLWVRFDKLGLDRLLRERGLPLWGDSRPGILVWLGIERDGRRELVGVDAPIAQALTAGAVARGLGVQWPLMDLEDQAKLTTADLWSDYGTAVTQASARYAQPLVLTGRLRQVSADHWEGRWVLYEGDQSRAMKSSGVTDAMAAAGAVNQLADALAARYAPAGGQHGPDVVRVQINGIRNVSEYAQVLKLVGEREMVDRVVLRSADDDRLLLDVLARGGRDGLAQVLDLLRNFTREPTPLPPLIPGPVPPVNQQSVEPSDRTTVPAAGAPVVEATPAAGTAAAPPLPALPSPPAAPVPRPVDLVYRVRL